MKSIDTTESKKRNILTQGGFQIFFCIILILALFGSFVVGRNIWFVMGFIPIYWIVERAYRFYEEDGDLSNRVLNTLLSCVFPSIIIVAIIVGFDMSRLWPIAAIAIGLTTFLINRR